MELYSQEQIANIVGADKRTRFAFKKKYKQEYTLKFWIEELKKFNMEYSKKLAKAFKESK